MLKAVDPNISIPPSMYLCHKILRCQHQNWFAWVCYCAFALTCLGFSDRDIPSMVVRRCDGCTALHMRAWSALKWHPHLARRSSADRPACPPPPPLQATHAAVYPVLEARLAARASGLSSRIKAAEVFKGKSCTVLLKAGGGW